MKKKAHSKAWKKKRRRRKAQQEQGKPQGVNGAGRKR